MSDFKLDSDATAVARALALAAGALSDLEAPDRAAAAILEAAPMPVRTGALAASVRADWSGGTVTAAGLVRYWSFVEWGAPRRNVRAQHPLRSHLEARTDDIIAVYNEHATRVVADIGD